MGIWDRDKIKIKKQRVLNSCGVQESNETLKIIKVEKRKPNLTQTERVVS